MSTQDDRPPVLCHARGDRCLGCKHYRGEAPVCEFAPEPPVVLPVDLRDYFAAKAMQANLARLDPEAGYTMRAEARFAYEWADAMLAARKAGAA